MAINAFLLVASAGHEITGFGGLDPFGKVVTAIPAYQEGKSGAFENAREMAGFYSR